MKTTVLLMVFLVACIVTGNHNYDEVLFPGKWTYDRKSNWGPSRWANNYPECGASGTQSPINIEVVHTIPKPLPEDIKFLYKPSPFFFNLTDQVGQFQRTDSLPNVHMIQLEENGLLTNFVLDAVRVHSPGEHTIDNKMMPVEFQFIHRSVVSENVVIISLLANLGKENTDLALIASKSPGNSDINWDTILPKDRSYFEYWGSLSAPPCTGYVRRFVLQNTITVSQSQVWSGVRQWHDVNHYSNRPVQPFAGQVWSHRQNPSSFNDVSSCAAVNMFNYNNESWKGFPVQSTGVSWLDNGRYLTSYQSNKWPKTTPADATGQYFSAPIDFRGNQSDSYNGVLSFQIKVCAANPKFNYTEGDIVIKGHRYELVTSLPYAPESYWWTEYEIRLNEGPWVTWEDDVSVVGYFLAGACSNIAGNPGKVTLYDSTNAAVTWYSEPDCRASSTTGTQWYSNGIPTMGITGASTLSWDRKAVPVPAWRIRKEGSQEFGTVATKENIMTVLGYVKCVNIRSRFASFLHFSDLDNVRICDGTSPIVECPGFSANPFQQCSGNGSCRKGVCSCGYGWDGADCSKKISCAIRNFPIPENVRKWKITDENIINPEFLDSELILPIVEVR